MSQVSLYSMAGLPIACFTPARAAEHVIGVNSEAHVGLAVHFITAHTISVIEGNPDLRRVLTSGDLLLPDSRWLELLSGIRRRKLTQVRGPDFFRRVLSDQASNKDGHFFIAPNIDVTNALMRTLERDYPELVVAGVYVAPHRPLITDEVTCFGGRD